jgi:chemotaxis protein CheX
MDEEQLRVFVSIVQHYFESQGGRSAEVGSAFLAEPDRLPMLDYTGVIGISGARRGCVYMTASRDLLKALLLHTGETDVSDANLADLAGEVANTISGNARQHFGSNFMISVPIVVQGHAQGIQMPREVRAYIIPLRWHKHDASLVVSLQ